jgi:16S rRNA G1207 methylase RsmC
MRLPSRLSRYTLASLERDSAVAVLDVGRGYGVVSEEILRAFPQVRVTLQDYSQPMLDHARRQLSGYGDRIRYVAADLCDPSWIDRVASGMPGGYGPCHRQK